MKKWNPIRILTVSWLFLVVSLGAAQAETQWVENYEKAKKQAQTEKKDLMINISGSDWCGWCVRLDKEVFAQEAFAAEAGKKFVFVQLDFPRTKEGKSKQTPVIEQQNKKLLSEFKKKFAFRGYPTVYLADAQGQVYAQTGYQAGGADAYVEHLDQLQEIKPLQDPGATWIEDLDVAKAKAKALKKDLLLNFSGSDWCHWCIRLDKEVFDQEYFKTEAPKDFILVKLDYPRAKSQSAKIENQNKRLAQEFSTKHSFQGYPSVYLADAQGQPYDQVRPGYQPGGPEKYIKNLRTMKQQKDS